MKLQPLQPGQTAQQRRILGPDVESAQPQVRHLSCTKCKLPLIPAPHTPLHFTASAVTYCHLALPI